MIGVDQYVPEEFGDEQEDRVDLLGPRPVVEQALEFDPRVGQSLGLILFEGEAQVPPGPIRMHIRRISAQEQHRDVVLREGGAGLVARL